METRLPAKSVLKPTTPTRKPTLSDEEKAKAERDRRNLGIALYHANIIQHQKDVQAHILSNIETLLDFPATERYTPEEASKFVSLAQRFQPSDLDSLVEERRIDGKCGYALCSDPPRSKTMGSSAAWKLKGKGAEDYCSNDCLRKSLYVKSQLSEVPAWEREPGEQPWIALDGDDISATSQDDVRRLREQSESKAELAMERGETAASFRPGQVMTPNVIEKLTVVNKTPIRSTAASTSHTSIEGYEPTMSFKEERGIADAELLATEELITGSEDRDAPTTVTDKDEREAWRDLFDNIDTR